MKIKLLFASALAVTVFACNQPANTDETTETSTETVAPSGEVFFENLQDGQTVKSPVVVQMGVKGMIVEPAGEDKPGYGHHHIIIDATSLQKGDLVPVNETNIHYGKGQTSDTLDLTSGKHTLTLQFANGLHQSYGPELSKTITINVE